MQKNRFTIIELLIVFIGILIFSGLAIPLFGNIDSSAGRMSCEDSLKKLMAGCLSYQADNNGYYPLATADAANKPDVWIGLVQTSMLKKYVPQSISLWGCPENKLPKKALGRSYAYNYGYNFWAFSKGMQLKNNAGFTNDMFKNEKNPANTVVFQDGANRMNTPGIIHWSEQHMNPQVQKSAASTAHNNGAVVNAGFADGHVAVLNAPEQTWNDRRKNGAFFKEVFPDAAFCYHTNYISK